MARKSGSSGAKTSAAIRNAGLKLIYTHGFEAMSIQKLADDIGIQKSSIYNYIASKQDLLFQIVKSHMEDLLVACDAAVPRTEAPGPVDRLDAFVRFHVLYHMDRRTEMFVSNSELRSLSPENAVIIIGLRKAYERRLIAILREGEGQGVFLVPDASVAAFGILGMLSGVGAWFNPNGPLSKDEVASIYSAMVLRSVRS